MAATKKCCDTRPTTPMEAVRAALEGKFVTVKSETVVNLGDIVESIEYAIEEAIDEVARENIREGDFDMEVE